MKIIALNKFQHDDGIDGYLQNACSMIIKIVKEAQCGFCILSIFF